MIEVEREKAAGREWTGCIGMGENGGAVGFTKT